MNPFCILLQGSIGVAQAITGGWMVKFFAKKEGNSMRIADFAELCRCIHVLSGLG
jgi:hypothetical protein